ncbi:hypothetical protein ACFPK1_08730 [Actinomycetospora rhizophila]|uniref:Uncharacterized protein n=1 Tax=Actinomycetospora rhizophila TaxID=1416876 RepID=A0ABV9Z9M3_9PSEU
MTTSEAGHLHRDQVCTLFALALDGHSRAEDELRELAVHHDGAAELLGVLACSDANVHTGAPRPADVAATDQVIAAVLEAVLGRARRT